MTDKNTTEINFGIVDKKGRPMGVIVWTYEVDGHFVFRPQATRNGVPYGASQDDRRFTSASERDAAIAKYVDGARKRAAH